MNIFSFTNCIRSLSDETISTLQFLLLKNLAYVAIKSSASNPSSSILVILKASTASLIILNCGIKSSGGSPLLAL